MKNEQVVTRFAPSPTGYFHAGSYRTALFSWIYARQHKGKFILRIEDTDKERSKKEFEDNIVDSLKWLGLDYDEFFRQSERTEIYRKYLKQLIDEGKAFVSKEGKKQTSNSSPYTLNPTPSTQNKEEIEVIRFKNPNKKVVFDDLIRGRIEFDTTELGDFVIAKNLDEPIFHFVVVVDDLDMGITHIIRGEDHISNTPRQILIYEALGAKPPHYAHIPLLLAEDKSKLSKRHGAVPITDYRAKGFLPAAIVNYPSLLGWHPADDREVLSLADILLDFSLDRVQKSGAIFNEEKLRWFNKQYLNILSDGDFLELEEKFLPSRVAGNGELKKRLLPIIREKISAFDDVKTLFSAGHELAFVEAAEQFNKEKLLWKKNPDPAAAKKHLEKVLEILAALQDDFTADQFKAALWPYAEAEGKGDVLWPTRMALTGQDKSPDPFVSAFILGKEQSIQRLQDAIKVLS